MKKLLSLLFIVHFFQPGFSQQLYFEGKIGLSSTSMDTSLHWYGVYRKPIVRPKIIEQRLYLKPIQVTVKKDSFCLEVSTDNTLASEYLIGLKTPILADSVTNFRFFIDHDYVEQLIYPGEQYSFGMEDMGQLKLYANGSTKAVDDSVSIDQYKLIVAHQCLATPYGIIRGWQFTPGYDVYKPCIIQELNALLEIPKRKISPHQLPLLIGAIDLNNDLLFDLIVLHNHEFHILLTSEKTNKKYFSTVKKMQFEFGFF